MIKEDILKYLVECAICKEDLNIYLNYLFDEDIQKQIIKDRIENPKSNDERIKQIEKNIDFIPKQMEVVNKFNALDLEDRIAIIKHYKEHGLDIKLKPPYMEFIK